MERYIHVLSTVVDTHAPLLHRTITPRPNAPWYTEQLRESKRKRRSENGEGVGRILTGYNTEVNVLP